MTGIHVVRNAAQRHGRVALLLGAILALGLAPLTAHAQATRITSPSGLAASDTTLPYTITPGTFVPSYTDSAGGNTLTFTDAGQTFYEVQQGGDYTGAFSDGTNLLATIDSNGNAAGPLTITFASGVTEFGLYAQNAYFGLEMFTFTPYSGTTSLGTFTTGPLHNTGPTGLAFLGARVGSGSITSVVISSTSSQAGKSNITVVGPVTFSPVVFALSTLSLSPSLVQEGPATITGTITLTLPAPPGGTAITLSSSDTGTATVPSTVTVAAGLTSATFPVTVKAFTKAETVTIAATGVGATKTAALSLSAAKLSALSLPYTTTWGGNPVVGRLSLTDKAPLGGMAVALSSSDPAVATVPSSVTVPPGETASFFEVKTKTVSANTNVTIAASAGGVTKTQVLTVTPPLPPTLRGLSPDITPVSPVGLWLAVIGTHFISGSIVKCNGVSQPTTYRSSSVLYAALPASLTNKAGTAQITVTTPHIGTSGSVTLYLTQ